MINWPATIEKYGKIDLSQFRPKVVVQCDKCGKKSDFTIRVKSRIKDNNLDWQCYKCACGKPEIKEIHKKQMSEQWKDEKYCHERANSSKKLWEKEEYKLTHKSAVQKEENRKKCSDAAIQAWKDDEYRRKHAVALVQQLIKMPKTEIRFEKLLDDLNVEYNKQVVVGPYSFDFSFKGPNKTILIEINSYWHTRANVIRKDLAKISYINSIPGYELKTIWDYQLSDPKLLDLVKHWTGKDKFAAQEIDLKQFIIYFLEY